MTIQILRRVIGSRKLKLCHLRESRRGLAGSGNGRHFSRLVIQAYCCDLLSLGEIYITEFGN